MMATLAPACARPRAIPRPMPPLPPVTSAAFPVRLKRLVMLHLGSSLLRGQVRDEGRVVGGPRRNLDHGDAHPGGEELLVVRSLVRVAGAAAAILHDQVH